MKFVEPQPAAFSIPDLARAWGTTPQALAQCARAGLLETFWMGNARMVLGCVREEWERKLKGRET